MRCRTCGTEIADKAIVCYRCGAATASGGRRRRRSTAGGRAHALVVLALVAAGLVLIPRAPDGAPASLSWLPWSS